jgi:hypothetical protein
MAIKAYAYFVMMIKLKLHLLFSLLLFTLFAAAQTDTVPVYKGAVKANRQKTYSNIVKNSIIKNLSLPLTDSTEESWEDAFYAMELIRYKQPWVNEKIRMAFDSIDKRSFSFQRALMELVYTNYPTEFGDSYNISNLLLKSTYPKIFAMSAEYLLRCNLSAAYTKNIKEMIPLRAVIDFENDSAILLFTKELMYRWPLTTNKKEASIKLKLNLLFKNSFLPGSTIVYSFQRKNRNYTGIAIVRDTAGNFISSSPGKIFSVAQLARSITNMPGYLTNGNTPQGIFRMYGFDISKSAAIGPTENIQLTMPFETSVQHFLKDSTITDSVWTPGLYERLLPAALKKYHPLFGTYYASAIGRTEIIAHGTTVDPEYYKGQLYYPYTPTQGCLCTKEIWSDINGKRIISDQQKLVDAVKKAGGADGYLIVIEIDDQQKPVTIDELLPYIKVSK